MVQVLAAVITISSLAVAAFGVYRLAEALRRDRRLEDLTDYLQWPEGEEPGLWRRREKEVGPDRPLWPIQPLLVVDDRATRSLVALIVASLAIAATTTLVEANTGGGGDGQAAQPSGNGESDSDDDDAFAGRIRTKHRVPKRKAAGASASCATRIDPRASPGKAASGGRRAGKANRC